MNSFFTSDSSSSSSVSSNAVSSTRIIYTPSTFVRSSLIHLQKTGTLQGTHLHKNERSNQHSCLFFTLLSGTGKLLDIPQWRSGILNICPPITRNIWNGTVTVSANGLSGLEPIRARLFMRFLPPRGLSSSPTEAVWGF